MNYINEMQKAIDYMMIKIQKYGLLYQKNNYVKIARKIKKFLS